MADKRFNIVFSGRLVEGRPPQEVLAKLCSVLEMDQLQIRGIFKAGFGAVICEDMEGSRAYALREDLREAGAICSVQETTHPAATEPLSGGMGTMEAPRQERPVQRSPQDTRQLRPPQPVAAKNGPGIGGSLFRLILVAALVGAGWWGYQTYLTPP